MEEVEESLKAFKLKVDVARWLFRKANPPRKWFKKFAFKGVE